MSAPAVMFDLETMGKSPTSAIMSLGAVKFDPHSDWIGDTLELHINLNDAFACGLDTDASTILWWLEQSEEARHAAVVGQLSAMPLAAAMHAFRAFFPARAETEIWCNGNSFDLPILANAYRACRMEQPWHFWKERDLRTLKALHRGASLDFIGTRHNALADAIHQARLVQHIFQFNPDLAQSSHAPQ